MSFKWKGTALGAIAAPFTGGISLAGGYLYDTNKQQNEANKKAVDRANAYDMYTWDIANQYNDPSAQMKRLAAAGLNPNLVYGSQSVTGNTTGTAGSNGVASQIAFNAVEKGLPIAQGLANLRNTNSQNELLKYQMGQTMAQTAQTRAETRNLNNFLTGNGRSTYDPAITKTIDNSIDRLDGIYSSLKDGRYGEAFSNVGDVAYKSRSIWSKHPASWPGILAEKLGGYIRERFLR